MTTITLVKKVRADGSLCDKCGDVVERLERDGLWGRIDHVMTADERDPQGEGWRLAERFGVERAPFFVVERAGEAPRIYTVYLRLLREVLRRETDERDEAAELVATAGVDFI